MADSRAPNLDNAFAPEGEKVIGEDGSHTLASSHVIMTSSDVKTPLPQESHGESFGALPVHNLVNEDSQTANHSTFSLTTPAQSLGADNPVDSGWLTAALKSIYHLRVRYESKGGGRTRLRLHFLTNIFYLNSNMERSFQHWCVKTQLRSNRNLLIVT